MTWIVFDETLDKTVSEHEAKLDALNAAFDYSKGGGRGHTVRVRESP